MTSKDLNEYPGLDLKMPYASSRLSVQMLINIINRSNVPNRIFVIVFSQVSVSAKISILESIMKSLMAVDLFLIDLEFSKQKSTFHRVRARDMNN